MRNFSAHLGYLFNELPLERRFAAARAAGFTAVEHPAPYAMPAPALRRHLAAESLELIQIALPAGDPVMKEKGMAALPGREAEFRASVATGLDYAVAAGARHIQVQSGLSPAGADPERMWDTYLANLRHAAQEAARRGLTVLIEPIGPGTIAGYFMGTSALALRALAEIQDSNVALLFDVFHATNAGEDPVAFVSRHAGAIGHLHIADFPGRHEPGSGRIDFPALYRTLDEAGYRGAVGCEYQPSGTTEESLAWLKSLRLTATTSQDSPVI